MIDIASIIGDGNIATAPNSNAINSARTVQADANSLIGRVQHGDQQAAVQLEALIVALQSTAKSFNASTSRSPDKPTD